MARWFVRIAEGGTRYETPRLAMQTVSRVIEYHDSYRDALPVSKVPAMLCGSVEDSVKFRIDGAEFSKAVGVAIGAIGKGSTIPVLANLLLDCTGGALQVTGTDLELSLIVQAPVISIDEPGKASVPAIRLSQSIDGLADELTVSSSANHRTSISGKGVRLNIAGLDPASYPELPEVSEAQIPVDGPTFSQMLSEVICVAGHSTGVVFRQDYALLEIEGGKIRLVACDKHRMALSERKFEGARKMSCVIPLSALRQLAKLDTKEGMCVSMDGNHICFRMEGVTVLARKREARFPDYRLQLKTDGTEVTLNRAELLTAIRLVRPVIDGQRETRTSIALQFSPGAVKVSAISEHGDSEVELSADSSIEAESKFNDEYLTDFLESCEAEKVTITVPKKEFTKHEFRPAGETGFLHIIMPKRI